MLRHQADSNRRPVGPESNTPTTRPRWPPQVAGSFISRVYPGPRSFSLLHGGIVCENNPATYRSRPSPGGQQRHVMSGCVTVGSHIVVRKRFRSPLIWDPYIQAWTLGNAKFVTANNYRVQFTQTSSGLRFYSDIFPDVHAIRARKAFTIRSMSETSRSPLQSDPTIPLAWHYWCNRKHGTNERGFLS